MQLHGLIVHGLGHFFPSVPDGVGAGVPGHQVQILVSAFIKNVISFSPDDHRDLTIPDLLLRGVMDKEIIQGVVDCR